MTLPAQPRFALEDLRQIHQMRSPATTTIGVAYMRNGHRGNLQESTNDHTQADKALRLRWGTRALSPSPYFLLCRLDQALPEGPVRREILMVSEGMIAFGGGGPQ